MSCVHCQDTGLQPFLPEGVTDDSRAALHFALCLCRAGRLMRHAANKGRSVAPLWRVWCAREQVDASRVHRLEDVARLGELEACGFGNVKAGVLSMESRLLATGSKGKAR